MTNEVVWLRRSDLTRWDDFVDHSPQGSLFCKSWWLQAVSGAPPEIVVALKGNEFAAGMPIVRRRRFGLSAIVMPPLTPRLGILFRPSHAKRVKRISEEQKLAEKLIRCIPTVHQFDMVFHPSFTDWLPFYWNGFGQTTRYSYVLDNITELDGIWAETRENIRSDVRKAERSGVTVSSSDDPADVLHLARQTFASKGYVDVPFGQAVLLRLDSVLRRHGRRRILVAKGSDGRPHAAAYLVWDNRRAYYLIGGGDPSLRRSGATSLCLWQAIQYASTVVDRFDFEGSMLRPVERFFRAFGGRQEPCFRVTRGRGLWTSMLVGALEGARQWRHLRQWGGTSD